MEADISEEQVRGVRKKIAGLFAEDSFQTVRGKIEAYFNPENKFAADTFNILGGNRELSIELDDLLALTTLDVYVTPPTMRRLLFDAELRTEIFQFLGNIPTDVDLWKDEAEVGEGSPSQELWTLLEGLPGVGWVTAGKLLARKRPRLIPIYDEIVRNFYQLDTDFWTTLQASLLESDLLKRIEELRPLRLQSPVLKRSVSTLRLLDVAIWTRNREMPGAS
jgi:hypothetical protein